LIKPERAGEKVFKFDNWKSYYFNASTFFLVIDWNFDKANAGNRIEIGLDVV
jgi:hypothetical protein